MIQCIRLIFTVLYTKQIVIIKYAHFTYFSFIPIDNLQGLFNRLTD